MNGINMQLKEKPTDSAVGKITVIKNRCYNLLVGREGAMLIRLQNAQYKNHKKPSSPWK